MLFSPVGEVNLNVRIKLTFQASLVSTFGYTDSRDMQDFLIEINLLFLRSLS